MARVLYVCVCAQGYTPYAIYIQFKTLETRVSCYIKMLMALDCNIFYCWTVVVDIVPAPSIVYRYVDMDRYRPYSASLSRLYIYPAETRSVRSRSATLCSSWQQHGATYSFVFDYLLLYGVIHQQFNPTESSTIASVATIWALFTKKYKSVF